MLAGPSDAVQSLRPRHVPSRRPATAGRPSFTAGLPHLSADGLKVAHGDLASSPSASKARDGLALPLGKPFRGGRVMTATEPRVAHLPLEVEVTDCSASMSGREITAEIRQFKGGSRNLLVRFEVVGGGGSSFVPLRVQPIDDGEVVEITVDVPTSASTGLCRVSAADAAVVQGDAARDTASF